MKAFLISLLKNTIVPVVFDALVMTLGELAKQSHVGVDDKLVLALKESREEIIAETVKRI